MARQRKRQKMVWVLISVAHSPYEMNVLEVCEDDERAARNYYRTLHAEVRQMEKDDGNDDALGEANALLTEASEHLDNGYWMEAIVSLDSLSYEIAAELDGDSFYCYHEPVN